MKKVSKKPGEVKEVRGSLLLGLAEVIRGDLREFVMGAGMMALQELLERDRTSICGPRYRQDEGRTVHRAGYAPGSWQHWAVVEFLCDDRAFVQACRRRGSAAQLAGVREGRPASRTERWNRCSWVCRRDDTNARWSHWEQGRSRAARAKVLSVGASSR